ncbi:putative vacuolar protein sorting-associated protein [Lachnellula willkommii]|uniref:Putative vacuolar protein sorting-associated protein n=1 Tax=Lachnellula willkommii TaxID=215461 RepID=A0A559M822_9HELO|nr:putative vacuolar protein sorting-associated protein [Lachnellula willkommii]
MMDPHDDVELSDLEDDAFLPHRATRSLKGKSHNRFLRWVPPRMRAFLENMSRIRLVIITVIVFILLLVFISYWNGRLKDVSIPKQSLALSKELARNLSDTAIPEYVLTYAPLVFLDTGDEFYPSDMAAHVSNTHPTMNFTPVKDDPEGLTLDNLNTLNDLGGDSIYLTSTTLLTKLPNYLHGQKPDKKTLQTENAVSCVIALANKEDGILDAFYIYFYTFNDGPTALGRKVGNHLGDWEHNMIRFKNGEPQAIWYSQHEYGEAFTYDAVNKIGKRPIGFSAKGSHANYAVSGAHDLHALDEEIPAHIAFDQTSQGPLWDPTLSAYYYTYSSTNNKFAPANDKTPVNYLYFEGQWGDQEYLDSVEGQEEFHGFHKWTSGPQGPIFKHLDRKDVCLPRDGRCIIKESL